MTLDLVLAFNSQGLLQTHKRFVKGTVLLAMQTHGSAVQNIIWLGRWIALAEKFQGRPEGTYKDSPRLI